MHADYLRADWPAPANILAGTTFRDTELADLALQDYPCRLKQVHGNDVVVARQYDEAPSADAVVSDSPGQPCVIQTADCLPVLFCARDGSRFGAAHAGWRGLAAGVLENSVGALGIPPQDLLVWFGPAISQTAFEVGDDVRDAFVGHDARAMSCFIPNDRGRWQADLYGLARQRLNALDVGQIFGGGECTFSDQERYVSYRREPGCGRLYSFVARQ